jgi:polysaccharide export outer membrane protein
MQSAMRLSNNLHQPQRLPFWRLLLLALVCVVTAEQTATATAADQPRYLIQPGDSLVISVWKETDLQMEVLIRPDGGMSFPLVGDLNVADRTVEDVRKAIVEGLSNYMPTPVVMVALKQIGGNHVYVIGKVNRPGDFPFSKPLDVMQALSLAGGATSFAATNDIQILRRDGDKQIAIPFHYSEVEKGRALEQNVVLRSGDVVVVP